MTLMLRAEQVLEAFRRLSGHLAEVDVIGEIQLLGGTVMMLAFQAREATKDVDAIFAPTREIRAAAAAVAAEMGLEPDWLNDGAKGFASPEGDYSDRVLPQYPNLRLLTPTPEYMLAMKVMAARSATLSERGDRDDIRLLLKYLRLINTDEVIAVVQRYYPAGQILPRSLYLVEEILQQRAGLL
jgi:hypothetical protein